METKAERLFEDLEPDRFKFATEGKGRHSTYYDLKTAKKDAKRQHKLEKQRRKAEEMASLQIGGRTEREEREERLARDKELIRELEEDIWHLQDDKQEPIEEDNPEKKLER